MTLAAIKMPTPFREQERGGCAVDTHTQDNTANRRTNRGLGPDEEAFSLNLVSYCYGCAQDAIQMLKSPTHRWPFSLALDSFETLPIRVSYNCINVWLHACDAAFRVRY
jgi:hypothetical protein